MLCCHALFEGVLACVISVLTASASSTPEVSDRAIHHHNYGSAKVVCITPKNKPQPKEQKRPEDWGVLMVQRKRIKTDDTVRKMIINKLIKN
jgi:hypothetical protein